VVRTEHTQSETVLGAYRLDVKAEDAVDCLTTMEGLCRRIRRALRKQGKEGEKGLTEAEELIVRSHDLLWKEVMSRWYIGNVDTTNVPAESESVSISETNSFDW